MKNLVFSNDLLLPITAVTQKLAFLGISGSGKTYGAGKFTEELLDVGAQVVVIDTIGNWWGLRLASDGIKEGISIPIIGGERGDVPLEPTAGFLVADTVAESRSSMIVDVSDFTGGELRRFVTDFANRLLKRKKQHKSPVMVIWEECQDIVPQFVRGESATMVGAVEKLIKKGRNYGVGTVLISQRPQAVNKDVLNQVETLFCFRTGGAQERKSIQDWIVHQSINVGNLVDELPALPTGTCFCWSPQWLNVLKKVKVGRKKTFDASATPEFGEEEQARALSPVDLDKLRKTMTAAVEKAKVNDPEHLRRRIQELEKELKSRPVSQKAIEVSVLKEKDIKHLERLVEKLEVPALQPALDRLDQIRDRLAQAQQAVVSEAGNLRAALKGGAVAASSAPKLVSSVPTRKDRLVAPKAVNGSEDRSDLSKCAREVLKALAMRHPEGLTRVQAATLAGYSHNSSGYANALSELNTSGYIEKGAAGALHLTDAGLSHAPAVSQPTTSEELLSIWMEKLSGKEALMLRKLAAVGDIGLTREELADRVELSVTSSGFANYLSRLNSNGLIRKEGGVIKADPLFR